MLLVGTGIRRQFQIGLLLLLSTGSCVAVAETSPTDVEAQVATDESYRDPRDPFEGFNRAMWAFNYKFLDRYIMRPVVHFYADYVPMPVQSGLENAIRNLDEPSTVVNAVLQGKGNQAVNATARFLVNTTLGLVGIFDVASSMGLERSQEEFGEVMANWGVGDGPYVMWPVFGPGVIRDDLGDYIDNTYFPHSLLNFWQRAGRWALDGVNDRSKLIEQEALLDNALDPYVFVKEAYFQQQRFRFYDGNPPLEDDDEFLEEFLDEIE